LRIFGAGLVNSSATRERFILLDGLRGAAALAVITDHIPSAVSGLLPGRYLAVDFFFALSGFVLAHVYGARLAAGLSAGQLMRARVVRLYPLYIAATLAGALLAALKVARGWTPASWEQVAASTLFNAFYLPVPQGLSTAPDGPFPFNGPAWSLFFELLANLAFALTARRLTNRGIAAFLVVCAAAVTYTAFRLGRLDAGFAYSNFLGGFPRVFYAFFAGVLIYRLRERWRAPALPGWLGLVLLIAILAMPASRALRPAWEAFATIALFPLLIAFCANSKVGGGAARACAAAGLLSYGFYVFQAPVIDWLDAVAGVMRIGLPGLARTAVVSGLTIALVVVAQRAYEPAARRFLSARLAGPARMGKPLASEE
jgi:peptidoglycan/LPS O-acetylase OafA/YrhL